MPRTRSQRPARRARQLELVKAELRRDPGTTVPELTRLLQDHDLGARTVYRFRDEARAVLPPAAPSPELAAGWPLTVAAARLSIRRARLRRMISVAGIPAAQVDRATGAQRRPEEDWRALEGRFEAAVLRRPAVVDLFSPGRPNTAGPTLPPPTGRTGYGYWWFPDDVSAWVRNGRDRPPRRVTWWTRESLIQHLRLHPAGVERLCALPGFPAPGPRGRWDARQVRAWLRTQPTWRDQVAGEATLDTRAAAALVGLSYDTVRTYRTGGIWPPPDGWHGRTPRWSASTLTAWKASSGTSVRPVRRSVESASI